MNAIPPHIKHLRMWPDNVTKAIILLDQGLTLGYNLT